MRRSILLLLSILPALASGQVLKRDTAVGTFTVAPTMPGAVSTGTIQTKGLVSTALDTPVNLTFTAGTGVLPNATYYARVAACNAAGCTVPSTETSLAITTGGVNYNWGAVTGATSYKVYCRTTGAEQLCATVTAPTTTWLDDGSVTPSGAIPALGTSGNVSSVSSMTARDFTASAASGATALGVVQGARICLNSPTCSRYIYYDGTYANVYPTVQSEAGGFRAALGQYLNVNAAGVETRATDVEGTGVTIRTASDRTTADDWLLHVDNNTTNKLLVDKDGMLRFGIGNTGAAPTCDATQRGKLWIVNGGAGVTDIVTICEKSVSDTYAWRTLSTGDIDAHAALTLAAIGSTPNANGASLSGQALNLQPADGTYGGVVSTTAQTFAGQKTFTSPVTIAATALGTCGSGANVEGTIVMVAGSGTAASKMCVCVYRPTGTVYAWVNALADHENGFGTSTTCPATEPP